MPPQHWGFRGRTGFARSLSINTQAFAAEILMKTAILPQANYTVFADVDSTRPGIIHRHCYQMVSGANIIPLLCPSSIQLENQQLNKLLKLRIQDSESRTLDPGSRALDPGSRTLDPGSRLLDPVSGIQGLVLGPVFWALNSSNRCNSVFLKLNWVGGGGGRGEMICPTNYAYLFSMFAGQWESLCQPVSSMAAARVSETLRA